MLGFLTSSTTETVFVVYVAFQLLSAAVQSLPTPSEYGGVWYKSFYNFASIAVADFKSYVKVPTSLTTTETNLTKQPNGAIAVDSTSVTTTKGA